MNVPNFFIVGKPKAGTTALHQLLAQHPNIFMSAEKEPHHFHLEYLEAGERRGRGYKGLAFKDRGRYLELFAGRGEEAIVGESSTGYLYSRSAAAEIARFNPDARILMCFREPVDFLHSFHNQLVRSANETEPDFRKALELEPRRKRGEDIPSTTTFPDNLFYSEQVKYRDQAARFFDALPRSQIKVLIYEDFKSDNAAAYREVLEFLGVDAEFTPTFSDIHPARSVRFPKLAVWLVYFGAKRKYSIAHRAPEWLLRPARAVYRSIFQREGPLPALDPAFRRELESAFRPEVEKFSDFLGRDLCRLWGYDR